MKGHLSFPGTASRNGTWMVEDDRLAQLMEVFGPFPKALREWGARSEEFFDEEGTLERTSSTSCRGVLLDICVLTSSSGNLLRIPKLSPASLLSLMDGDNEVLQRPKDMPESEVPVFVDFLRRCWPLIPMIENQRRRC